METWQELKVTVKREGEELVSNLLIELGAQGVAIEDSMDYVGNVDRFGEIFPEVEQQEEIVVTAYYPDTVDVATVESDLQARLAELTDFMDLGEVKMGTTALAEEDWADNWKKYYEPARITHDLTIVPSWTDYEATAGEKIIKLDPGMAFWYWDPSDNQDESLCLGAGSSWWRNSARCGDWFRRPFYRQLASWCQGNFCLRPR